MKKKSIVLLVAGIILGIVFIIVMTCVTYSVISDKVYFGTIIPTFRSHDVEEYNEMLKDYSTNKSFMPKIEDITNYKKIKYTTNYQTILVFDNKSYILKVEYSKKEYVKQKDKINKEYTFIKEPISFDDIEDDEDDPGDDYIQNLRIPSSFKVNDIFFRYVKVGEKLYGDSGPKEIMLIGMNDNNNTIYYIFFRDQDLDFYYSNSDLMNYIGPLD